MIGKEFGYGVLVGMMITFPICCYVLNIYYRIVCGDAIISLYENYKKALETLKSQDDTK